jgi:predicted nucleic acid-binding protein
LLERYALAAPELLLVECVNALWLRLRRGEVALGDAVAAMRRLQAVPLDLASDAGLAPQALSLSAELDHPAYDCMYLALALEHAAVVVTADRRFAAVAAGHPGHAGRVRLLAEFVA